MEILYSALLLVSWLNPLFILPWAGWHQEVLVFGLVLLLGWHFLLKADRRARVAIPKVTWVFAGVAMVVTAQWLGGLIFFGGDALVMGFYLTLILICFSVGFALAGNAEFSEKVLSWLGFVVVLGSFCSVVIAMAQAFDVWGNQPLINRTIGLRRPGGNLGQPNHLATLILMGLASLSFLFETKKFGRTSTILLCAVLICGLVVTESRTGILGFFLLLGWWWARRRIVVFSMSPIVVSLVGAGLLVLLWTWPMFFSFVQSGNYSAGVHVEPISTSAGARIVVWPQLVEAMLQRPLLGWGLLQVSTAQNSVIHAYTQGEPFSFAHNIILDLAVGSGLPFAALLTALIAWWLWLRVQSTKNLTAWYCLAFALPLGVHSMLEFPFAYAYLLAPVVFALGMLEGTLAPRQSFGVPWKVAAGTLMVCTVLMAWSVVEYLGIEEDFRVARFEAQHIGETPVDYLRPHVILLTQLGALLADARIVPTPGMSTDQMALARKVALRFPWTATQNRYALSLALNGRPEEARRQIRVMRVMHGEKMHRDIMENWKMLSDTRYPQLQEFLVP